MKIRAATLEDANDLLAWKNDKDTRKFSIVSKKEIKLEDHLEWLKKTLNDPDVELYVMEDENDKYGDLRFDVKKDYVEVSIRMAKEVRGLGLGTQLLESLDVFSKQFGLPFMAKIVNGNIPSFRLFLKHGFKPVKYHKDGYYILMK